jgi:23S rRNA (cytosine1962-C5)-methyltransferase
VIFEDEHLLVVNKPAGLNTHAPSPFAGEGIYDWLRHREPRWAGLAIIHRLDKETSGVIVFGKSTAANRSLTDQFSQRSVRKKYLLLTDRPMKDGELVVKSKIARAGEKYVSGAQGQIAETRFKRAAAGVRRLTSDLKRSEPPCVGSYQQIDAEPLTGRTHQIRVHAAEKGFPILGDTLYGGSAFHRVCLHAAEITFKHPVTAEELTFRAPVDFASDARAVLRAALMDADETNAFRLIHGASDGWPGWYVERLGDFWLSQSEAALTKEQEARLRDLGAPSTRSARTPPGRAERVLGAPVLGVYHKILSRHIRGASTAEASPELVLGQAAPGRFIIRENGLQFELSFNEGYSVGLFLDQRDNRRRFLTGHIAAGFPLQNPKLKTQNPKPELLNVFAYTCGFSVCAARGGAKTTSLDLSKKYLEWGRRNFALNGLDPAEHDFIYGDAFDWLRRLAKKGRAFDAIVLDPPTFSQSKERGAFRVEKNYGELVSAALPLLKLEGVLLASTNATDWPPEKFIGVVEGSVRAAKRKILRQHYSPQPPDFPVSRPEPAYLKTVWLRIS